MMLGMDDPWVAAAYILCVLSSLACVIYGALNWNKDGDTLAADDQTWAEDEDKFEEEF
ncbi:MAG: hypothetical protein K9N51_09125 [Candidatus Pacebacteria bacterium]|nr:hypothetical protein [Candidatus Paceibacterota bacterium]